MLGTYSGLQARIKDLNFPAVYVPCSAHSLNIVGSSAVGCCMPAENFFDVLQELYNFFSNKSNQIYSPYEMNYISGFVRYTDNNKETINK